MIHCKRVFLAVGSLVLILAACAARTESDPSPTFYPGAVPEVSENTTTESDTDMQETETEPVEEDETLSQKSLEDFPEGFWVEYNEEGLVVLKYYRGEGGEVVIPDGIQVIGPSAFDGVSYYGNIRRYITEYETITSVYIPDTVTVISNYAFQALDRGGEGLRTVRMSSNIKHIGKAAFACNSYLEKVTLDALPEHTVHIADKAFCYCESLTEITLPDSILMGKDVFIGTPFDETYAALYGTLPEEETEPVEFVPPVLSPEDMVLIPEIIITPENEHLWELW